MLGYCRRGSHDFAVPKGFDWMDFLRNGIPASKLQEYENDIMVQALIAEAKRRIEATR